MTQVIFLNKDISQNIDWEANYRQKGQPKWLSFFVSLQGYYFYKKHDKCSKMK